MFFRSIVVAWYDAEERSRATTMCSLMKRCGRLVCGYGYEADGWYATPAHSQVGAGGLDVSQGQPVVATHVPLYSHSSADGDGSTSRFVGSQLCSQS